MIRRSWTRVGITQSALALFCLVVTLAGSVRVEAGAFIFAGESNGIDIITHPPNYTGAGGEVTVSVCIDPASADAAAMEIPVKNIVSVINGFVPMSPNLLFGGNNDIPAGQYDFESLTLHEFGHCLSLAHPNQGVKTGVSGGDTNATQSTNGVDNVYNFNAGTDTVDGSSDDIRGDDVNLHYFVTGTNNPFLLPAKADSINYTRDVTNMPVGHTFPGNAGRSVGPPVSAPDTEAVMQQGMGSDEDQRGLQNDDVATLMLGGTGLDEVVGGGDDYTIKLVYAGLTTSCDIVAKSDTSTSFASCAVGGSFLTSDLTHVRITSGIFRYNPTAVTWYFNPVLACNDILLDYAHDATIAHTACNNITTTTGFNVGVGATVTLKGATVTLGAGTSVSGTLSVQTY